MMPHQYANSDNNFCYVYGEITLASQKQPTELMHTAFDCDIGDQNKYGAPHSITYAMNLHS